MVDYSTNTYDIFIPTIWSPRLDRYFRHNLKAANFFTDYSDEVTAGGDTVRIPSIGESSNVSDVKTTTGTVDAAAISDTGTDLNINNWKYDARRFTDYQVAQVLDSYRLKDEYASEMGYQLAKTFDTALLEEARDNLKHSVGDTGSTLSSSNVEHAMRVLGTESVPTDRCTLFCSPGSYWTDIMGTQKYVKMLLNLLNSVEVLLNRIIPSQAMLEGVTT